MDLTTTERSHPKGALCEYLNVGELHCKCKGIISTHTPVRKAMLTVHLQPLHLSWTGCRGPNFAMHHLIQSHKWWVTYARQES